MCTADRMTGWLKDYGGRQSCSAAGQCACMTSTPDLLACLCLNFGSGAVRSRTMISAQGFRALRPFSITSDITAPCSKAAGGREMPLNAAGLRVQIVWATQEGGWKAAWESGHRVGGDPVDHYLGDGPGSDGHGRTRRGRGGFRPYTATFSNFLGRCAEFATPGMGRTARHLR